MIKEETEATGDRGLRQYTTHSVKLKRSIESSGSSINRLSYCKDNLWMKNQYINNT